jgi:branched-chain amino acid transport system substrate-binding protein
MKQRVLLIALLLLAALLLASCGTRQVEAPAAGEPAATTEAAGEQEDTTGAEQEVAEPAAEAPEAIDLGAVVPLTGRLSGIGIQVERGYRLAVEKINEDGGVYVKEFDRQIPLRLNVLDDESDPSKTVSQMEAHYSSRNIVAYLGGAGGALHAPAAAIAEKNKVPYLGVAFALWTPHKEGYKYLFSPFFKSPDIAENVFKFLNETIPEGERPTRVGIFQEQSDWGIELGGLWRDKAEEYGYEVVLYEEYALSTPDFTDLILKAQEADVQALLALPTPPDGLTIYKQMGELGFTPDFSFFIRAPDVPTWPESLGSVGDYIVLSPGWHNSVDYPGVDELNAAHQEMMGRPADVMVGPSYSAIQILADAIERAGTLDRDAIRDALATTDIVTVQGPISFREDGTANVNFVFLQYQHGKMELVWPTEMATADFVYPAPPFDER